jgi:hypothetical protein
MQDDESQLATTARLDLGSSDCELFGAKMRMTA